MNVAVCIKQVPGTTNVKINPETNTLIREGVESIINPFDMYAIEEALRLKTKLGGKVTALSMGPPQAASGVAGSHRGVPRPRSQKARQRRPAMEPMRWTVPNPRPGVQSSPSIPLIPVKSTCLASPSPLSSALRFSFAFPPFLSRQPQPPRPPRLLKSWDYRRQADLQDCFAPAPGSCWVEVWLYRAGPCPLPPGGSPRANP